MHKSGKGKQAPAHALLAHLHAVHCIQSFDSSCGEVTPKLSLQIGICVGLILVIDTPFRVFNEFDLA